MKINAMRGAFLLVLACLIGCSSRGSQDGSDSSSGGMRAGMTPARDSVAQSSAVDQAFTRIPDRGSLFEHVTGKSAVRRGPQTLHPVSFSEDHALAAIGGKMHLTIPDGRAIELDYQRHAEHDDGSWTWVGRNARGEDAVITIGRTAVYGSIPDGLGGQLQLTTDNGKVWLVETDSTGIPEPSPRKGDYLVAPPAVLAAAKQLKLTMSADAASPTMVDVAAGFSLGLATRLGGQSQAVTRLNYLAEITNQSYINSQLNARIRLVAIIPVDYPDAVNQDTTLRKLTGYETTVDPAFTRLREAREQFGADLVSFVHQFRAPENDGCGLAWMLGAELSGISPGYAPYGYSVVGDGNDLDETDGLTYGCSELTFAHELGHNMGQQHNMEDGDTPGAHTYSYGYREETTTGFYTVMAYRLPSSSQFRIRHFSSPLVNFDGRVTGTPTADNVRSMAQTIPAVAAFRAPSRAFNDVPFGYWAFDQIQRLYQLGVTSGCVASPLQYCPDALVTRDQMALFILKAKYGAQYQTPTATGDFSDVPIGHWADRWIEELYAQGITAGCAVSPLRYCPDASVPRDQMAVFLVRARHGSGYQPPAATGMFADVPTGHWAAAWIEQLARDGVTLGCGTSPLRFCPDGTVTRAQMAVFLVRNFALM